MLNATKRYNYYMYISWGFFNFKELICNQSMLFYHLFNWMSPFNPIDILLLTLHTILYPMSFLFVLCQIEHQQTTWKDVRVRWYTG